MVRLLQTQHPYTCQTEEKCNHCLRSVGPVAEAQNALEICLNMFSPLPQSTFQGVIADIRHADK